MRLSGTGTVGATLRLYLEKYALPSESLNLDTQTALKDLEIIANELGSIKSILGREEPSVVS